MKSFKISKVHKLYANYFWGGQKGHSSVEAGYRWTNCICKYEANESEYVLNGENLLLSICFAVLN